MYISKRCEIADVIKENNVITSERTFFLNSFREKYYLSMLQQVFFLQSSLEEGGSFIGRMT